MEISSCFVPHPKGNARYLLISLDVLLTVNHYLISLNVLLTVNHYLISLNVLSTVNHYRAHVTLNLNDIPWIFLIRCFVSDSLSWTIKLQKAG